MAPEPIVQHDQGSHQVGSVGGASSLRAVTVDALGGPHRAAPIGCRRVNVRSVGRLGAKTHLAKDEDDSGCRAEGWQMTHHG